MIWMLTASFPVLVTVNDGPVIIHAPDLSFCIHQWNEFLYETLMSGYAVQRCYICYLKLNIIGIL